jgi:hypothetical protein
MACRTVRNRTVELSQQEDVSTSQGECDWPHDQPEQLDKVQIDETTQLSPAEINETTATEIQVISTNTTTKSENYSRDTNANDQSELRTMLASVLTKLDKLDKLENKLEALEPIRIHLSQLIESHICEPITEPSSSVEGVERWPIDYCVP